MIKIGRIVVSLETREVYLDGQLLQVGARAFDILELLIRASGKTVTKDEILEHVWPNVVVEENNIHVQLSALRKIFGADSQVIRTISGRGYRLAIPIELSEPTGEGENVAAGRPGATRLSGLPVCHARLFGRDQAITEITRAMKTAPIVTLLGSGGIGKTQLGIAVAKAITTASHAEVCFVSLAAADCARSVANTVADALGVPPTGRDIHLESLLTSTRHRNLLVLLDNCEHVIEPAAKLCELLVQRSGDLRVLATSREPLRTRDEAFYWVAPLGTPIAGASGQEILDSASVRMFLAEMHTLGAAFESDANTLEMVATICRRLDGVPLALELAAARAAVFGVRKLVSELDDRFQSLTGGRRTAPPRQQTLEAALDWGYRLLLTTERVVLHRLGVFEARFSLDTACAVAVCDRLSKNDVMEAIVGLASKCFLMTTFDSKNKEYFLLETTREYALRKLHESDEAEEVLMRKAACQALACDQSYARSFSVKAFSSQMPMQAVAS
jgi:predicted ATPase/DNA-binding winged helix-turn-helix (wHTH) protein